MVGLTLSKSVVLVRQRNGITDAFAGIDSDPDADGIADGIRPDTLLPTAWRGLDPVLCCFTRFFFGVIVAEPYIALAGVILNHESQP